MKERTRGSAKGTWAQVRGDSRKMAYVESKSGRIRERNGLMVGLWFRMYWSLSAGNKKCRILLSRVRHDVDENEGANLRLFRRGNDVDNAV